MDVICLNEVCCFVYNYMKNRDIKINIVVINRIIVMRKIK